MPLEVPALMQSAPLMHQLLVEPSVQGTSPAAQDADVDQPNREHVLTSPAQRAEHQADAG